MGEPHPDGKRTVFHELNGQPREVEVADRSPASSVVETPKADPSDPNQIGAPLPGLIVGVAVADDDPSLAAAWSRLDLLRGRPIRVALGPRSLSGIARGIDPEGALLVDDGRETQRLFGGRVLRGRARGR